MQANLSSGRVYSQQPASLLDEELPSWPSASTCAWPTPMQADLIGGWLRCRKLTAVSIGCGDGVFECMLERRGVTVHAVDLDVLSNPEGYRSLRRFCAEVRRVRPDQLFDVPLPAQTALCFFWGRATPWREYLARYPQVPIVIIAGELNCTDDGDCATSPSASALDGIVGWRCTLRTAIRAVRFGAIISIFERTRPAPNDGAVTGPTETTTAVALPIMPLPSPPVLANTEKAEEEEEALLPEADWSRLPGPAMLSIAQQMHEAGGKTSWYVEAVARDLLACELVCRDWRAAVDCNAAWFPLGTEAVCDSTPIAPHEP